MPETPDAPPPPTLIPRDHPMRAFYEAQRQGLLLQRQGLDVQIARLGVALGLGEGNARQRRERERAWHNDGDVQRSA